jgi:hypothetical protein
MLKKGKFGFFFIVEMLVESKINGGFMGIRLDFRGWFMVEDVRMKFCEFCMS